MPLSCILSGFTMLDRRRIEMGCDTLCCHKIMDVNVGATFAVSQM